MAAGATALFGTLITIAPSATIVARWYGFGHALSSQQTWTRTVILLLVFVAMGAAAEKICAEQYLRALLQVNLRLHRGFPPCPTGVCQ